jgi:hypothetical protein
MQETSLQDAVQIELNLVEKADAVSSPTHMLLQISTQDECPLPPGTSIDQVYHDAEQELLILGAPGIGKSTLLVELALHLVTYAERDEQQPLPVIIPLSSWATKRLPLGDWLGEQISKIYDISPKLSNQWVRDCRFLPMLDGLDEMDEEARPACIAAINAYHCEHMHPLVVCSRQSDYSKATTGRRRLALQNAIVIQPFTEKQIDSYLSQVGKSLSALRSELKKNAALRSLATIPLWFSVMMLTYRGTSVRHLSSKRTKLQQQMMRDYVKLAIERKGDKKRYPSACTIKWLSWLARAIQEHNQSIFSLEHLELSWLPKRQQVSYRLCSGFLASLIIGGGFGLIGLATFGSTGALIMAMIAQMAFWKLGFWTDFWIKPLGGFTWSWRDILIGIASGSIFGFLGGLLHGLTAALLGALTSGLVMGPLFGLAVASSIKQPEKHRALSGGIRRSARIGLLFGFLGGLVIGLIHWPLFGLVYGLFRGLITGLIIGFVSGLGSVLLHYLLRFLIWHNHLFPWNAYRFLRDAQARTLVQRTGNGYSFSHRLLLDYFANLSDDELSC